MAGTVPARHPYRGNTGSAARLRRYHRFMTAVPRTGGSAHTAQAGVPAAPARRPARGAVGLIAASTATIVAGLVVASLLAHATRAERLAAREPVVAWAESAALALLVLGAWLALRRPVVAVGCAVTAFGIGAIVVAGASDAPPAATSVGIALAPAMVAAATAVALEYAGRPASRARWATWGVAAGAVAATALILVVVVPIDEATCLRRCPDVAAPLSGVVESVLVVAIGAGVSFACVMVGAIVLAHRPALAAGWTALGAGAVMAAGQAWRAASWDHIGAWPAGPALLATGAALLGATVVVERGSRLRTAAELRRLAERLRGDGAGRAVFPALDEDGWLDAQGDRVEDVSAFTTELVDDHGTVARLELGRRARSLTAAELDPADLLAVRNARMTAAALARVRWLDESRRAVVESTGRERARVEHDLHDGAQQRLVSALLFLAVARREQGPSDALAGAEDGIRTALERLRALSHGTDPHDSAEGRPSSEREA